MPIRNRVGSLRSGKIKRIIASIEPLRTTDATAHMTKRAFLAFFSERMYINWSIERLP